MSKSVAAGPYIAKESQQPLRLRQIVMLTLLSFTYTRGQVGSRCLSLRSRAELHYQSKSQQVRKHR